MRECVIIIKLSLFDKDEKFCRKKVEKILKKFLTKGEQRAIIILALSLLESNRTLKNEQCRLKENSK